MKRFTGYVAWSALMVVFSVSLIGAEQPQKTIRRFEPGDSLEVIREKIKHNGYKFTVEKNWVSEMPPELAKDFLSRHAPRYPARMSTGIGPLAKQLGKKALPSSFDWRNFNGRSYIGPIRDQGACGSCYAFGACAMAESRYNWLMGLYDGNCVDFSEAFVAFCLSDNYGGFDGCNGSNYDYEELDGLVAEGVCYEAAYPYTAQEQDCQASAWNAPRAKFSAWYRVPCGDVDAIKTAIMTYGVVDAAVLVGNTTSPFATYSTGVYNDTNTTCPGIPCEYTDADHAIALVGWNDDGDPVNNGYWILRNSWGTSWGENGYMRIRYNAAHVACEVTYLAGPEVEGKVLIATDIDGLALWWDPTSSYEAAVKNAGYTVAAKIAAPAGGDIPWPAQFTANEYDAVLVLTGENFLAPPQNISPADEAALQNYLDTGGCVLMVGQDIFAGAHPTWGAASGFFKTHMGLDSVVQDTVDPPPAGAATASASGAAGGILAGTSFTVNGRSAGGPFGLNELFIDTLTPVAGASALIDATGGGNTANPCAISYSTGTFKTVFSTVELGATDPASFNEITRTIMQEFITPPTPIPAATPIPLIDLKPNKTNFSTTDYIEVRADVQPIGTPFYPYVRIIMPNGVVLYYVSGLGFTTVPSPYLGGGPFVLQNYLGDYLVLAASYSIVQTGTFLLEGYPSDTGGNLIGTVDTESLLVQ